MTGLERTPPAIEPLIERLAHGKVRYVVFGSGGAWCYGANLTPGDFDICPTLEPDSLQRRATVLIAIDARPRTIPGWLTAEESTAWSPDHATDANLDHMFEIDFGNFDVVPRPFGPNGKVDRFDFSRLNEQATNVEVAGLHVRVAGINDLIVSKLSQRRGKDLDTLPELERLRERIRTAGEGV